MLLYFAEQTLGGRRVILQEVRCRLHLAQHACEGMAQAVMQIAAQSTASFFASCDNALARAFEIGCEQHAVYRDASLTGKLIQEMTLTASERLTGSAWCQNEFTNRLAVIDERQAHKRFPG